MYVLGYQCLLFGNVVDDVCVVIYADKIRVARWSRKKEKGHSRQGGSSKCNDDGGA